jgi:hypothetical protein
MGKVRQTHAESTYFMIEKNDAVNVGIVAMQTATKLKMG